MCCYTFSFKFNALSISETWRRFKNIKNTHWKIDKISIGIFCPIRRGWPSAALPLLLLLLLSKSFPTTFMVAVTRHFLCQSFTADLPIFFAVSSPFLGPSSFIHLHLYSPPSHLFFVSSKYMAIPSHSSLQFPLVHLYHFHSLSYLRVSYLQSLPKVLEHLKLF